MMLDPGEVFLPISVSRNLFAPDGIRYRFSENDKANIQKAQSFLAGIDINAGVDMAATGLAVFYSTRSSMPFDAARPDDWYPYDGDSRMILTFRVFADRILLTGRCEYVEDDYFEAVIEWPAEIPSAGQPVPDCGDRVDASILAIPQVEPAFIPETV